MIGDQAATIQWNAGAGSASGTATLAALFAAAAARHPHRVAVSLNGQRMTYAELDRASASVASSLCERGLEAGALVAICLDRSLEMIVAMLGVIKTGSAYLPLDTRYPCERIVETIADAAPAAVIGARTSTLRGLPPTTLFLNVQDLVLTPATALKTAPAAGDAAYIIYTSGSTGKPKGVIVTHANVVSLLQATQPRFRFDENDVWTMFHSFAFDFSVWEIWGCLLYGGHLVIVPYAVSRSPEDFHALLLAERVTILNQTPSAFALLDAADERASAQLNALRLVIFGGEALPPALLANWFSRHGESHPRMINMYGITETTVHVTWREMRASDALTERESLIGEAIPSLRLHLLDEALHPVKPGEEGELVIGGAGVSAGYLNRPELTRERFVADPAGAPGAMLYRSGDLARRRADGELVYLGRRDGQVKINGFRIELGEVESALLALQPVKQACVIAVRDDAESGGMMSRLAAYFVADRPVVASEISSSLARVLPAHMLPAFYLQLPVLPINDNGKVDRKALPTPRTFGSTESIVVDGASAREIVAAVWRTVLRTDAIGFDDNFFDIGGTSVLLIAVRNALQQRLNRAIPIAWMFEHTTVNSLAGCLENGQPAVKDSAPLELNARRQRDAFARARAARQTANQSTRSIA